MNEALTAVNTVAAPSSGTSRFFRGLKSGATSGAVMMGVVGLVSVLPFVHLIAFPGIAVALGMTLCTGLFSGVMSVMRGDKSGHSAVTAAPAVQMGRSAPALGQGVALEQSVEQSAPEQTTTKWADKVGKSNDRMQEILNRDMSDKNRAAAILAEREQAANSEVAR